MTLTAFPMFKFGFSHRYTSKAAHKLIETRSNAMHEANENMYCSWPISDGPRRAARAHQPLLLAVTQHIRLFLIAHRCARDKLRAIQVNLAGESLQSKYTRRSYTDVRVSVSIVRGPFEYFGDVNEWMLDTVYSNRQQGKCASLTTPRLINILHVTTLAWLWEIVCRHLVDLDFPKGKFSPVSGELFSCWTFHSVNSDKMI